MINLDALKKIFIVIISLVFISCEKEQPSNENEVEQVQDYRLKFIGTYYCTGLTHDWNEATGLDEYSSDTINLIVKIDNSSNDKIYVNNDLITIDTSGFFYQFYFPNYHDYYISFFERDSVDYRISTGGNGGGHWGKYLGSK